MRFDNQIKCTEAQGLIDEARTLLDEKGGGSKKVSGLVKRIGAQVFILDHCISHSPPKDQIDMRKAIADLKQHTNLLQGLADDKKNKKKSKK